MKTKINLLGITALLFVSACTEKHIEKRTFTGNSPIYLPYESLRASVKSEAPRELQVPGKILYANNRIFVSEFNKGVHVIDNSNPSSPQNIAYINIPGNMDITIKDNTLFADSYTDLVAIDVNDINNVKVQARVNEAFAYAVPRPDNDFGIAKVDPSKGVVIGWETKEIVETCINQDCSGNYNTYQLMDNKSTTTLQSADVSRQGNSSSLAREMGSTTGTNGSMSRFLIYKDYLYTINGNSAVNVYHIANAASPVSQGSVSIGTGIETLFSNKENLFIGSQTGMFIYSLTNPLSPTFISEFDHVRRCDPVLVHKDYAYVTLRGSAECGGVTSELNVIDVKDVRKPFLVTSYDMIEPYGLGMSTATNSLFICDGRAGLKVYNAIDPAKVGSQLLSNVKGIKPYDIIPIGNNVIVTAPGGIYQYNCSDPKNLQQLSIIPAVIN